MLMALEDPLVPSPPQPPVATNNDGVASQDVAFRLTDQLALDHCPEVRVVPEPWCCCNDPIARAGQQRGQCITVVLAWLDQQEVPSSDRLSMPMLQDLMLPCIYV